TPRIHPLSLHDALPISRRVAHPSSPRTAGFLDTSRARSYVRDPPKYRDPSAAQEVSMIAGNAYTTDRIRNVVFLGHGGCGKTTRSEEHTSELQSRENLV